MASGTILYIEDNLANRMLVRRVLEIEGYTILEAEDGPSGLEIVRQSKPDLILLDINLPQMDGYELLTHLRKVPQLEEVPIIALTANVMKGDRERCLETGMDEYISKPIRADQLFEILRRVLRK